MAEEETSRPDLDDVDLTHTYPRADGASGESAAECCPCEDDSGGDQPSIYQEFWGDARAQMERRDYAKALATVGGLTALGSLAAPLASLTQVFERGYSGPVYSDGVPLVDEFGERISEGRLNEGDLITVFPEPRPGIDRAPTLLVRFAEDAYGSGTQMESTVGGYAAYSKVCTHAGCMVSNREGETLICPCHSGRFDPLSGASVTGGPPGRALPQLPITLSSDGYLVATGDFEGPVGPGGD